MELSKSERWALKEVGGGRSNRVAATIAWILAVVMAADFFVFGYFDLGLSRGAVISGFVCAICMLVGYRAWSLARVSEIVRKYQKRIAELEGK